MTPGDGLSTVMDPNLPPWIGEEIRGFAPLRQQIAASLQNDGVPAHPELNLLTTNGVSGDVSVIDAKSLKVLKSVKVGRYPWGVVVTP